MQTRILRNSTASQVGAGQRLWVWYAGELLDGTPFDANFSFATFTALPQRTPFSFILGAGEVIRGWDEALTGQRLGTVVELTIPSALAYGSRGAGSLIPPDADLRFTVELIASGNPPDGLSFPDWGDIGVDLNPVVALGAQPGAYTSRRIGLDGSETLTGSDANDLLAGLAGDDELIGLAGDDLLLASRGEDLLTGNEGKDILDGGDGGDQLSGGGGGDRLIGGTGADQFLYALPTDSAAGAANRDTITDFNGVLGDRLNLTAIDANALRSGNQPFRFIEGRPFSGRPGEVRFAAGLLQVNTNSSRRAEMEILLSGVTSLSGGVLNL